MIRAAFDSIIVEPIIEEEQKFGNIIVPDTGKEKGILAKVIYKIQSFSRKMEKENIL